MDRRAVVGVPAVDDVSESDAPLLLLVESFLLVLEVNVPVLDPAAELEPDPLNAPAAMRFMVRADSGAGIVRLSEGTVVEC